MRSASMSIALTLGALAGGCAPTAPAPVTLRALMHGKPPKEWVYRTVGGRPCTLSVYAPPGHKPTDRRPAIVTIHGGGWMAGSPKYFAPMCRYFASRGLVGVNITYRLCEQKGVTLFDCVSDAKAAVRFVRANAGALGVDPNRIAVAGDSAGGHLAVCVGVLDDLAAPDRHEDVRSRADAVLAFNPIVDITTLPWAMTRPGVATAPAAGYKAAQTPAERARRLSPIFHVTRGLPPMLLMHGTEDKSVPIEQIDRFAKAMKAAGNRCDYKRMTGWAHAFVLPDYACDETVVPAMRVADEFLATLGYVRGAPTLVMDKVPLKEKP